MRISFGSTSISPVAILSLTAPERLATSPTMATTYSERRDAAFSRIAGSVFPSSHTTWMMPERSRTSTKTSPPLFLFFCTHPMTVTVSPTFAADSSPQRWVLFNPCIDSAIVHLRNLCISLFCKLFLLELLVLLHVCQHDLIPVLPVRARLRQHLKELLLGQFLLQEICLFLPSCRLLLSPCEEEHDNTLKADGESYRRGILTGKFADHLIIASAAAH